MKATEANLISWKLVIDSDNKLVTEISSFPEEEIHRFQKDDRVKLLAVLFYFQTIPYFSPYKFGCILIMLPNVLRLAPANP